MDAEFVVIPSREVERQVMISLTPCSIISSTTLSRMTNMNCSVDNEGCAPT